MLDHSQKTLDRTPQSRVSSPAMKTALKAAIALAALLALFVGPLWFLATSLGL